MHIALFQQYNYLVFSKTYKTATIDASKTKNFES